MKLFEMSELTEEEKIKTRHYFQMEHKMRLFEASCTPEIFVALYGETEGNKLREKFMIDCGGSLIKWFSAITSDQKDRFWVQLLKYENLAKQIL